MKGLIAGIACLLFLGSAVSAQSIYSSQGLGLINNQGNPSNFAMGGLGIATPTLWNINTKNPAYLTLNPFSTFEVGLNFDRRNFSGDGISGSDAGGGLNFLAYAFPIKPGKWSSSFGILPYSTVNYDIFSEGSIEGAPNNSTFLIDQKGEGGLANLFWSNGVAVNKNLSLGFKSQFIFGSIERETKVAIFEQFAFENTDGQLDTVLVSFSSDVNVENIESYKGVAFQFGLAYRVFLAETKLLNFGLIMNPRSSLSGTIERQDSSVTSFNNFSTLPASFGIGISYQEPDFFSIGFDFETQAWKNAYSDDANYQNSTKIVLGASWTPDYDNVNSYIKRIRYSMGLNYQELPYIVNNQGLTDFGINFGASLPVSGYSSFDMAFKFGQLGETSNGLIKETYFKVVIGATINDRWFIKRKYD